MQGNRSKDTKPELALRRELHARGLRYFKNRRPIQTVRRTADIVFPTHRLAVFIDGCFWHGCPDHHTVARTNADYWSAKVERNRNRDHDTDKLLADAGWTVLRIWEHVAITDAADLVEAAVRQGRDPAGTPTTSPASRTRSP
jgi:DNA mismatch endonuclease, patch repair protein